ncbi:MAG TPA: HEAT repeat domain-containing protein [Isosphaeraceae bacterium]|nr:HEAT repeat domain-containing protein [Isosphaeraceae bacterium]
MAVDAEGSQDPKAASLAAGAKAPGKLLERVRLLIALVVCGAGVFWAGRVAWETRNPAVAAARNLRSSDRSVRLEAVQEVAMQGITNPRDAIPALIGALDDQDERVRIAAAKQLGFVCSHAIRSGTTADAVAKGASALRASVKDPVATVRIESARSLGILGGIGFAIPRRNAGDGRGKSGTGGKSPVDAQVLADLFKELAGDPDAGARLLVWQALGAAGPKLGIEVPQKLMAGLETEPPDNHEAAIKAVTAYGPAAASATPVLIKFLKEAAPNKDRANEAERVARALGRIAPGSPAAGEAVASLTEALQSESPVTRGAAVKAIEQFGPQNAASAVSRIKALENDPDSKVRDAVKSAIKTLATAKK